MEADIFSKCYFVYTLPHARKSAGIKKKKKQREREREKERERERERERETDRQRQRANIPQSTITSFLLF